MNALDFTESSRKIFALTLVSVLIIVFFVLSPLNTTSFSNIGKFIVLILLGYIFYLNMNQIQSLQDFSKNMDPGNINSNQIQQNVVYNYVFLFFVGLMAIFTLKSFM